MTTPRRLLVFDLDGTLVDSRRDLADAANALIIERGGAPLDVDQVTAMVGEGAAMLVRRALTAANVRRDDVPEALARFLELYDERLLAQTRPYDGTRAALDALRDRAVLALLTNKPQHHTDRLLAGLDLTPYFRWVIGGDTSHGRKPDPAGLRHLMAAAGVTAAETVMIGDSAIDLRTARAAGTRCCLVRYGFGFPTAAAEISPDDLLAATPAALPHLLTSF
jgi:phosphoglycolate phosphatase